MATYTILQILGLVFEVGIRGDAAITAAAISLAESGGRTDVVSRTNDVGLWQINLDAHPQYTAAELKNPETNARAMAEISNGGTDWTPWVAYNNGSYRRHLPEVQAAWDNFYADQPYVTSSDDTVLQQGADAVADYFGLDDLAGDAMVIALTTVFTLAGLTLATLGLFQLAGTPPRKTFSTAATAATGAGLAKTALAATAA